jgi:hypothetical protein
MTAQPDAPRAGSWGADLPPDEDESRERLLDGADACFAEREAVPTGWAYRVGAKYRRRTRRVPWGRCSCFAQPAHLLVGLGGGYISLAEGMADVAR